jgi:hypothetical protein
MNIRSGIMIDVFELRQTDKGSWVKFSDGACGEDQLGRIKSWDGYNIFVVYHCDEDWENYANYTAEATHGSRLEFIEKESL